MQPQHHQQAQAHSQAPPALSSVSQPKFSNGPCVYRPVPVALCVVLTMRGVAVQTHPLQDHRRVCGGTSVASRVLCPGRACRYSLRASFHFVHLPSCNWRSRRGWDSPPGLHSQADLRACPTYPRAICRYGSLVMHPCRNTVPASS